MDKSKDKRKDKKKYTGWPGDCSQQQLIALEQFRGIVAKKNGGELRKEWDQYYLLRYLRARKFNMEQTQKMWVNFIEWRQKNNVDSLKTSYYFPELIELRKKYPHGYHKHDRKYRPIYIQRLGFANADQIFKFTTPDRLLSYYTMLYQTLLTTIFDACTRQKQLQTGDKERVIQTCTILDLQDISLGNASAAYKFVKPASQMAQDNYPEILGTMFIINAPMLFTVIWAVVKVWIDQKTKEKIKIMGSSYKQQLLKYIDPENLPSFIDGGTCKCKGGDCLSINVGPWNQQGKQFFPVCLSQTQPAQNDREYQSLRPQLEPLKFKQFK